jgi:hypothetical protein
MSGRWKLYKLIEEPGTRKASYSLDGEKTVPSISLSVRKNTHGFTVSAEVWDGQKWYACGLDEELTRLQAGLMADVRADRWSANIRRQELITMVATLRGILVEFDTVYGLPADCAHEVRIALKQTSFSVNDDDLVAGGFAELEEDAPRAEFAEMGEDVPLAEAIHKKWQSLASWTMPQAFDDLSEAEQCRWMEVARWLRKEGIGDGR